MLTCSRTAPTARTGAETHIQAQGANSMLVCSHACGACLACRPDTGTVCSQSVQSNLHAEHGWQQDMHTSVIQQSLSPSPVGQQGTSLNMHTTWTCPRPAPSVHAAHTCCTSWQDPRVM